MLHNSIIDPNLLLQGYANGVFPMADNAKSNEVYWVEPKLRGIIPLNGFHVSRSLKRVIKKADYTVTFDSQFNEVVSACADRNETWINSSIYESYQKLFKIGNAHSVEIIKNKKLIGGVYGVTLGSAFFGESMFSKESNGSKIALKHLVDHLNICGFTLFDAQFQNSHLQTLGCIEITQKEYLKLLKGALVNKVTF
ncbi:leucyl/phenylalanyl-tRNA--protein transferase [Amylibacter sp.]|jgi:leucyl/phenylalanyl-tRNA--protein transferase|nr:leucyl/phenylalanyl-tRNA--protein transferase [Amylibacter sp.]MDB2372494.1 leucyl/phenylalanyl-tRNA--protein transferase [Amylibacter sp.]MDB2524054.1 leucyl/phenylalanyl-tRNA--protein transferase [Amylibacter sp.]MDB2535588.1 leucyl/phenylalanyl-tRNA--protein transferase [Amylibacter sp.]MDB2537992.1 leucyl/phenylalanyl-tRNA--protein transferase [Amylibacter sp.]